MTTATSLVTASLHGIQAEPVFVETDVSPGLSTFTLVGLADASIQEARERIRSALRQSGYDFPKTRITINLAPADQRKSGSSFDLPIAVALLSHQGLFPLSMLQKSVFVGELGLDGGIRPVRGALSMAIMAKRRGYTTLFVAKENAEEASCVRGVAVVPVAHLKQLVEMLRGQHPLTTQAPSEAPTILPHSTTLNDIRGHSQAKRALEIAAAGGHNLLLYGPPGSGKTLLARAFPSLLPPLSETASLEATQIHSAAGSLPPGGLIQYPPFRSPHHTSSLVALVGGGSPLRPGEISLAHEGVLFLDEFPEYPRAILESLRQPLEDRHICLSRSFGSCRFPARFQLFATMNPCPCGYHGSRDGGCKCHPGAIEKYRKRLSGPILDRIDLFVHLDRLHEDELQRLAPDAIPLEERRERIVRARTLMQGRVSPHASPLNADRSLHELEASGSLDEDAQALLRTAVQRFTLSARGYTRLLRVARSIADLGSSSTITKEHLSEAITYRKRVDF